MKSAIHAFMRVARRLSWASFTVPRCNMMFRAQVDRTPHCQCHSSSSEAVLNLLLMRATSAAGFACVSRTTRHPMLTSFSVRNGTPQ